MSSEQASVQDREKVGAGTADENASKSVYHESSWQDMMAAPLGLCSLSSWRKPPPAAILRITVSIIAPLSLLVHVILSSVSCCSLLFFLELLLNTLLSLYMRCV